MALDIYNDPHAEKRGEIFRRIQQGQASADKVQPGKSLSLTEDNRVVDSDDEAAAFLLVGENGSLPKDLADELGVKAGKKKKGDEEKEEPGKSGVTIVNNAPPATVMASPAPAQAVPQPAPSSPQQPTAAEPAEKKA